jgi:hypothetical protein
MQFTTILLAALASISSTSATPLSTTTTPNNQVRQEGTPSCTLIPATPTNGLSLAIQPGFAGFVRTQDISFTIPPDFPGPCQLEARFPADYPITTSGNGQTNVIAKDGPDPGAVVGTVTFASDEGDGRRIYINSFACEGVMGYTLELAGTEGTVDFEGSEDAGLFMAVGNCW